MRLRRIRTTGSSPSSGKTKTLDGETFFTSFYKSSVTGEPDDRATIAEVTEVESRFHYNATENAIIRGLVHRDPIPEQAALWQLFQKRREWHVMDIGSGAGHWIDFYKTVFHAAHVTGVEFVPQIAEFLEKRYSDDDSVRILRKDITAPDFSIENEFDIISAIGVMFHIVDESQFVQAMQNMTMALKPGGVMVIGGDFGPETREVQFHKHNEFESWQEHDALEQEANIVNKKIRSLADWHKTANTCGLLIEDLVRTDADWAISTPENDILIMAKPEE